MFNIKFKPKTKLIFTAISIGIIFILIIFTYVYYIPYLTTEKSERTRIESIIGSTPELPIRFYEIYNTIYPKSLDQGQLFYLVGREFNNRSECPCRLAASATEWISSYRLSLPQKTFFIESFASQKECLNYFASITYFGNDIRGIKNASLAMFNKNIEDLNDKEYIEIILVMKNPSLYNKKRHPEFVTKRIDEIIKKIGYASKP